MAGETILVVDDTPVNLRLAAAVLRSEGYDVHLASTAEEALITLKTLRPALILVDIQLPGMDGLELTRRLRQDSSTRGLLLVALTASDMKGDQDRAFDAGCDGYISKPFDTRTLGSQLRAFLGQSPDAVTEPAQVAEVTPYRLALAGFELESLRRDFLADGIRQTRRMLELLDSQTDAVKTSRVFHQWVGSAGALGYMEISGKAREAEKLLASPGWTKAELREALTNLTFAFGTPREAADMPLPQSIVDGLIQKRIALVGFADEVAERVCLAFERVNARPQLFGADEPAGSESVRHCAVVMVYVRPETMGSAWLRRENLRETGPPLVLVGGREDLLAVDPEVQSHASEFLVDGWQPEEVLMRLSLAISRAGPERAASPGRTREDGAPEFVRRTLTGKPAVILIADDDVHVLAVVQVALQDYGMLCRSATNGPQALLMAREIRPNAVVLDVNMPEMDGFAVLQAIRRESLPMRVVMLTARQDQDDVLRGFNSGADDYIVKPFNPLELVARLKRLL
jgi:DNA-binding response OmpR family regulator